MNRPLSPLQIPVEVDWETIDTVMLDMDGTLLDKYYDDYFWETYVPKVYAALNNLELEAAKRVLLKKYGSVENTLQWSDLLFWSEKLGLDIPRLKEDVGHLITVHPHVTTFLEKLVQLDKQVLLITNAHPKTLDIKLERTGIGTYFQTMACVDEIGFAKEQSEFWDGMKKRIPFDRRKTLFADDTEKVLHSAQQFGLAHLIHIARPSSRLPVRYSEAFSSILDFSEIMPS